MCPDGMVFRSTAPKLAARNSALVLDPPSGPRRQRRVPGRDAALRLANQQLGPVDDQRHSACLRSADPLEVALDAPCRVHRACVHQARDVSSHPRVAFYLSACPLW